jgi:hypothetical protein
MKTVNNLVGRVFGRLTVLSFQGTYPQIGSTWLCQCECGNTKIVRTSSLMQRNTKSCGCLHTLPLKAAAVSDLMKSYKRGADRRSIRFELDEEQFASLILGKCFYCGTELSNLWKSGNRTFRYNGVDRRDSKQSYSVENCVSCCRVCNRMKSDMTPEAFLQHVNRVHDFQTPPSPQAGD